MKTFYYPFLSYNLYSWTLYDLISPECFFFRTFPRIQYLVLPSECQEFYVLLTPQFLAQLFPNHLLANHFLRNSLFLRIIFSFICNAVSGYTTS